MKKKIFLGVLLAAALPVFSQTRDDIRVYIAPVLSTNPVQAQYFQDNFTMETVAAGYNVTDDSKQADYTVKLEVQPNMILYDDGTMEQAPDDEGKYLLQITLVRNEDDADVVAFSFPFTNVDDMSEYNLYLLYEAMANVPLTKLTGGDWMMLDDRWRNKWFYIRVSLDYPITFYALKDPLFLWRNGENAGDDPKPRPLDHRISPWLAATLGFEVQYFNWMSTELNFNLSFSDPMSSAFVPAIQIEQKFPVKPASLSHFMIEPYIGLSFPMNTSPNVIQFPAVGLGGGFQMGVKGGSSGAFFIDLNFIYFLGDVIMRNTDTYYDHPERINYSRFVIGIGLGYKVGFVDRPRKDQPVSVTPPSLIPPSPPSSNLYYDDGEADTGNTDPVETSTPAPSTLAPSTATSPSPAPSPVTTPSPVPGTAVSPGPSPAPVSDDEDPFSWR